MKNDSKIEQLIKTIRSSLDFSKVKYTEEDVEHIALVVFDSMSHPGRNFHNVYHIFDVAKGLTGLSVLAAVFHDIVYFQVDQGFKNSIRNYISEVVVEHGNEFELKEISDSKIQLIADIFGYKAGVKLNPLNGLNEFLSAVVALRLLGNILSLEQLVELFSLIESTIPFRKDSIINLKTRLVNLKIEGLNVDETCKRAVDFSNNDVFNFSEKDARSFLKNTWNLISETNYSLRRDVDNYSVTDYRTALYKTYSFFNFLDPENVFSRFENYPSNEKWEKLFEAAHSNILIGRKYLQLQLISFSLIEAIALLTGGNVPMSVLMGDIRRRDQKIKRMEDYLDLNSKAETVSFNKDVMNIFLEGRSQESSFDMKGSPLSAFVYLALSDKLSEEIFPKTLDFFNGRIQPKIYLKLFPKKMLIDIISACSKISSTRKVRLDSLSSELNA